MSQAWQVRLAEQAELDFLDIATGTKQLFCADQAERQGQCAMREWLSSHNSSSTKASGSMPALQ